MHYFNREYVKYEVLKKHSATLRKSSAHDFARRRALILTLKKLADRHEAGTNLTVLHLLREIKPEIIEKTLKEIQDSPRSLHGTVRSKQNE
ncbi:MAG: hypothetical protein JXD19_09560 [Deltaproteobacteria bacterium]|nr:hypothetical protein [Deltaproteobacteria bacterium]